MLVKIKNIVKKSTKAGRPMNVLIVSPLTESGDLLSPKAVYQFRNFQKIKENDIVELKTRENNNGFNVVVEIKTTNQNIQVTQAN